MDNTFTISWGTIVRVLAAALIAYTVFLARNILIWFFFALIISILLQPAVKLVQRLRLPKIVAVIVVYLAVLGVLGYLIYLTAPIFLYELGQLSQNLPEYFQKASPLLRDLGINVAQNFEDAIGSLMAGLQQSSQNIAKAAATFLGGVTSAAFILTLSFFISLEDKGLESWLALLAPKRYEEYVLRLFERVQVKVAGWFMARVLACLFVGAASFLVFFLLGIKYSFTLALVAGVFNFIPYIGPTVTLVLATLFVGISGNWMYAAYAAAALLIIQEVENKFLSPVLMKRFIDLPPVLVLMALMVGGVLFGFLGTVFSVPVFGIIYEFTKEFLEKRKQEHLPMIPAESTPE